MHGVHAIRSARTYEPLPHRECLPCANAHASVQSREKASTTSLALERSQLQADQDTLALQRQAAASAEEQLEIIRGLKVRSHHRAALHHALMHSAPRTRPDAHVCTLMAIIDRLS